MYLIHKQVMAGNNKIRYKLNKQTENKNMIVETEKQNQKL